MLKTFDYHKPATLAAACRLLDELPEARMLAGGTDLLVDIETGLRPTKNIISLRKIDDLKGFSKTQDSIRIGAACTAREWESSALVQVHFPEIVGMLDSFASPQIRSVATVGGNLCSAVACSDFPVMLMALGACVELVSVANTRLIPLEDFFIKNRVTVRTDNEILTHITIPLKPPAAGVSFQKFRRRASNSLAVTSVAAYLELEGLQCRKARIVLGAVASRPMPAKAAAAILEEKGIDDEVLELAAQKARRAARPISDVRGSKEFRQELVFVLVQRALKEILLTLGHDQ